MDDEKKELSSEELDKVSGGNSVTDSLGDLSEVDQMKLQMTMDNRSKLAQTLSNVLKQNSDTANSIVQNLK